jgi:hypothetical protein
MIKTIFKEVVMSDILRNEKEKEFCGDWEKWWKSDLVDGLGWAAAFIWGALVILAGATNIAANFSWWDGWAVFFAGAGVIVFIEVAVRMLLPEYRKGVAGNLIFGLILLAIGLGGLVGWAWIWPLVLIAIAVVILRGALKRHKKFV